MADLPDPIIEAAAELESYIRWIGWMSARSAWPSCWAFTDAVLAGSRMIERLGNEVARG